jgi:hypothetical protein
MTQGIRIRPTRQLKREYSRTLAEVFAFMLAGGMSVADLQDACAEALRGASSGSRAQGRKEPAGLVTVARVLDEWHRNRRYLSEKATPKPIRLLGSAPSVEALSRARRGPRNAAIVAKRLRELGLVVPCGRGLYKPASEFAVVSKDHPFIHQSTVRTVSAFLETVRQNIGKAQNADRLIERFAEVPDLPRKHLAAFRKFSQMQSTLLLRTINDWLESRRMRRTSVGSSQGVMHAGVHVFAFASGRRRRST